MNKNGIIIIIEDDPDDQEILQNVFNELRYGNEVMFFNDGFSALDYLANDERDPFLILSDINLPKLDGFELREKLQNDEKLAIRCIPYLFFSTAVNQQSVVQAYSKSVQGFFVKGNKYAEIKDTIETIMKYWKKCVVPNSIVT